MKILVIDTATSIQFITAMHDESVSNASADVGFSHSVHMFHSIDSCLGKLNVNIHDLDLIAVGIGPGSFTGIRIAVTTARMFAQVLKIPLIDIPTQLLFAAESPAQEKENILVAFDAKKGRVFGGLYRKQVDSPVPETIIQPGDYPIQELLQNIDQSHKTYLIGDGIGRYIDLISQHLQNTEFLSDFIPEGRAACMLAKELYRRNPSLYASYSRVTPRYTRKSDAEIALAARKAQ